MTLLKLVEQLVRIQMFSYHSFESCAFLGGRAAVQISPHYYLINEILKEPDTWRTYPHCTDLVVRLRANNPLTSTLKRWYDPWLLPFSNITTHFLSIRFS